MLKDSVVVYNINCLKHLVTFQLLFVNVKNVTESLEIQNDVRGSGVKHTERRIHLLILAIYKLRETGTVVYVILVSVLLDFFVYRTIVYKLAQKTRP